MLSLRYLSAVRAVIRTGSIASAAKMLHLTQPAVTKSIQLAEEELGIKLFARVKGRLLPTEESSFLYPEIERIFGDIVHLQNLAAEVRHGHAGRILLSTVSNLSTSIVSGAITRFRLRHPNVRFDVEVHSTKLVLEQVRIGQVGLGVLDLCPKDAVADTMDLCEVPVGCVMQKDHALAALPRVRPQDLTDVPILMFPEATTIHGLVKDAFRQAAIPLDIALTVNHSYTACSLIDQGNGVGVIDPFHLHTGSFPGLVFRPFEPQITLRPTVVMTEGRLPSLITREFIDELRRTTAELFA
ncbi:LysR family transcriptional regulator [Bordetella ansorpii]|uniref:LysR family transcriptional regulator n=1 Tax=Bordetella ansorpii TaxID=288768 RepID=A0A157Q843_9BORD|nr:LysR family transcriptional regulator [Bordetella ansorpii]SAI41726.1 LysR family transcriptional regulator [Bordetella ansorpii]